LTPFFVMISYPMNMKKTVLLALVALGIFQVSLSPAQSDVPRTGRFAITVTPGELLGEAVEKVTPILAADELVSWQVHVPESYSAESPPGIVVYVSPTQSGTIPQGWSSVMDEHNLIWISADKSGNRVDVSRRILKAVLALHAIQQDYVLDNTRTYVAGFSGGGKVSSMISTEYANTFDGGLFICGVTFWTVDEPRYFEAIKSNRYVFLTGEHDQALMSTKRAYRNYQDAGVPQIQLVVVRDMGHSNPPRHEFSRAIEFLDNGLPAQ
jgi:poly(3-hydroxybutyrate) depolymerase